jgi:hypothetical protein
MGMPKLPFGFGKEKKGNPSIPDFFDQIEQWEAAERDEAVVKPSELQPATAHPQPAPAHPAPAPQPASQPAAPASRPAASQPASAWQGAQPAQVVPSVALQPVQGELVVDQLLELAKRLGMESLVAPVESLKRLAAQLDEEERRIQGEMERLRERLSLVRATRDLLRRIGV